MNEMAHELESCNGFGEVFEVVKKAVNKSLGIRRAGLTLVLDDIPNQIGAYHPSGSNFIVLNRTLYDAVSSSVSTRDLNAYLFTILTHEYLHSLGVTQEVTVRHLVQEVSEDCLGTEHPAVDMADKGIWDIYPDLKKIRGDDSSSGPEIVKDFDSSSMPYIA
jgi:hypothetical protein